jgi:hypothetical protein
MLDFARLWPPEIPTPGVKASFLVRMLRPELVASFPKPLCSDAFSRFQTGNDKEKIENNQEVADAFVFMVNDVIPNLCKELEKEITLPSAISQCDLAAIMHIKGNITPSFHTLF